MGALMSAVMNLLKAADRCVSVTARTVSTLALAGIFVMFIANVFVRFVPVYNFTQTDDWIQILLVWMIFPGAMELVRTRGHFVVDVITDRVAGKSVFSAFHKLIPPPFCEFGHEPFVRSGDFVRAVRVIPNRLAHTGETLRANLMDPSKHLPQKEFGASTRTSFFFSPGPAP